MGKVKYSSEMKEQTVKYVLEGNKSANVYLGRIDTDGDGIDDEDVLEPFPHYCVGDTAQHLN